MKIAIVTAIPFYARQLAESLVREGHDCTLLLGDMRQAPHGIQAHRLPILETATRALRLCPPRQRGAIEAMVHAVFDRWAVRHVSRIMPDLVVAWSSWGRRTLQWCMKHGIATAVERGSAHIEVQNNLLQEEFTRWGVKEVPIDPRIIARELTEYELASWVTVQSSFARDSFLYRGYASKRLEVVPLGTDTVHFRPSCRIRSRFRVLFVGIISLQKGVPYLLQAYGRVRTSDSELILLGSLNRPMRTLLDSFGVPYTHVPTAPMADVAKLISEASVLAHPSVHDGFARVLIEAMACGTPVITTTNTAGTDVVTEGVDGFVVPPRDVEALTECLRFLRDHPDQAEAMGAAARRKAEGAFTWEHYAQRVAAVVRRRLSNDSYAPFRRFR